METIKKEYKGQEANHLLLNPADISNLKVVLTHALNVLTKDKYPWNSKESKQGSV